MSEELSLQHHGIKGQKWGVRRTPAQLGHVSSSATKRLKNSVQTYFKKQKLKKAAKEELKKESKSKATSSTKKRSLSDFTDAELNQIVNRMRLEQSYRTLYAQLNPKTKTRTEKVIDWAGDVAMSAVTKAANDVGTQALKYVMGNVINKTTGKKIINLKEDKKDKEDKEDKKSDSKNSKK